MKNRIKLPKRLLLDILHGDTDEGKVISDNIMDTRRWVTVHILIFSYQGAFYEVDYSCGSTEHQDEKPWEFDGDMIEVTEVVQIEQLIKVWVAK